MINETCYNCIIDDFSECFYSSSIWKFLELEPNLIIDNKDEKNNHSFRIEFACKIFNPINNDFLQTINETSIELCNDKKINVLKNMNLKFEYLTNFNEIKFIEIIEDFNYLFCSWLINIEYIFPFIFSFYGRQFFKINYPWTIKCVKEIFDEPVALDLNENRNIKKQKVLLNCLLKIQNIVLEEYNTLNIFKEIDQSTQKRKNCIFLKDIFFKKMNSNKSFFVDFNYKKNNIKNIVYQLEAIDVSKMVKDR